MYTQVNCGICAKVVGNDILIRKSDSEKLKVCRPCYLGADTEEYTHGHRHNACWYPGCDSPANLRCDQDGHLVCSSKHKVEGKTYSHRARKCREPGCELIAQYAADFGATPVACGVHRKETEHDVVHKRCRTCLAAALRWYDASQLNDSRKKLGKCQDCIEDGQGPKRKFYEETICAAIALALDEVGVEYTAVFDKALDMHTTDDRRRPDAVFRFGNKKRTVFVEVDECQHNSGLYTCETKREADIFSSVEDLEADKLMIRINPDAGGAANTMFSGKPTVKELDEGRKPLEFVTHRFAEKITETVSLVQTFLAGGLQPGYIHYINWTTPAPPQRVGT